MENKIEKKVGLLLTPNKVGDYFNVIQTIHIHKSTKNIDYFFNDVNEIELLTNFSNLHKTLFEILIDFSAESINTEIRSIEKRFSQQRSHKEFKEFQQQALLRYLHNLFNQFKPFVPSIKCYHVVIQANSKSTKISVCTFSNYSAVINFDVQKRKGEFEINTYVVLNGNSYNLNTFNRCFFLLESNNEYFILKYKDYETIEWLNNHLDKYNKEETSFVENVLTKLEQDYIVNRNNLFTINEIDVIPTNRILLSELNNAFLMLTPQWLYDGFLVEGAFSEYFETKQNGKAIKIKRNKELEVALTSLLEKLHPNFIKQRNGYYYLSFAEATKKQWFFNTYHQLLELDTELVGMDLLHHFKYSSFKPVTTCLVKQQNSTKVLLQIKVSFGKEDVSLKELQKILFAGQKAVLLKDGSLGVFDDSWLQQYAAIIKHGKVEGSVIQVASWMAILEENEKEENKIFKTVIKIDWWQKWLQWQTKEAPVYAIPSSIQATLRPYQQKGFEWMALLADVGAGACLADDMGLGKTLQTICFLAHYIQQNPVDKQVIVCPASLIYNWQKEIEKFAPTIKTSVYHGAGKKEEDLVNPEIHIIITTYGTMRADAGLLSTMKYGVVVVDESHNIKNPSAQITKAVGGLQANIHIALSGTPVVNNTFDLYAQLNFALPGMFGSREFFKREYADAIDKYNDADKINQLRKLTSPFILRRTKEQVAKDLPDKIETILWCSMKEHQKMVYNDINEQIKGNIFTEIKTKGLNKSKLAVLQGITKLRQVCNSPLLLPINEQQNCTQSIKSEMLLNELQNILGQHKAIVFSQFSSMLHLLAKECNEQGINYFLFDGQTPPVKRSQMVADFQDKDCTTNLFLISLKAGNTGLTLTAADYVFLFDPWWNTAVEQQAIDRTHRIGQTKNVFAYKLICKDTIEEKIIQLQLRKKKLAEELITEDDGFVKSLTEEDIAFLFS